ncbi:hypothetical protein GCM10028832_06280 [Streptomyces sparsus]
MLPGRTPYGLTGQEERLTGLSPQAARERTDLACRALAAVDGTPVADDAERVAAAVLRERLATQVALAEADAYDTGHSRRPRPAGAASGGTARSGQGHSVGSVAGAAAGGTGNARRGSTDAPAVHRVPARR